MKYIFVVNSQPSKSGLFDRLSQKLKPYRDRMKYELYRTVCHLDATRFVKDFCKKNPAEDVCFVACGGDGTINEVASGLIGEQNKFLAVMPYGTGNDFVKYYKDRDFLDIDKLLQAQPSAIDIVKVNDRYSINVCNVGFESAVCSKANAISSRGGKNAYLKGLLLSVLGNRYNAIDVTVDGKKITRRRMLLCTLANCRYVGGTYQCAPKAINDDGLLEVCLVHPIPLLKFASLLSTYKEGRHLDRKRNIITYCRGRHVDVVSEKETELCLDGEILSGKRFSIDILDRAIQMMVPAL